MKNRETENIEYLLKMVEALQEDIDMYKSIDTEAGFRKTEQKIRLRTTRHFLLRALPRIAAIFFVPLWISTILFAYLYFKGEKSSLHVSVPYMEVTVAPGTITHFELPDQSKVWLNSGSKLRYPAHFTKQRRDIELNGEAYFEVKSDSLCPFVVSTPMGMEIIAKGTSFNVCAYQEENRLEAFLEEGRIDICTDRRKVTLVPQEELIYLEKEARWEVSTVKQKGQTSWKDGQLIFRNAEIDEVFRRLSRKYNVSFAFHGNRTRNYRFWASFSDETITQVMDYLSLVAPMEWELTQMRQLGDATFTCQQIDVTFK